MISQPDPRRRPASRFVLAAGLLAVVPFAGHAAPEYPATRLRPSSLSSMYGGAAPIGDPAADGNYVVATGTGLEVRSSTGGPDPLGVFRTAGAIGAVAMDGSTAYLFAGPAGIVAVSVADPANPIAVGAISGLGDVALGAAASDGYGLAAASDRGLQFLARTAPGMMSLLQTLRFSDNRVVGGIVARSDSFLVASARTLPLPRLFLTLYRLQPGEAAPESLWEAAFPNHTANGLAWNGGTAFVADGNNGILSVDIPSGVTHAATVGGSRFVYSVAASATAVSAGAQAGTYSQFTRSGPNGSTLINEITTSLPLEPTHVAIQGDAAIISAVSQTTVQEPDEAGASAIYLRSFSVPSLLGPYGGTGRTRRLVTDGGYAYVADYTGGLRIYRTGPADTSLVGVLPPTAGARVFDLALDPARRLVYLASASAGLQVADVSDPASPALLGTLLLPGLTRAVAIAGPHLVVAGWYRDPQNGGGITFVDVSDSLNPAARGQVTGSITDPRAVAVRDTVAFIADALSGVISVGFANPNAPVQIGPSSGQSALSLNLEPASNLLLVGAQSAGLQVVDVSRPDLPFELSEVPAPPVLGVARSGNSAILLLGGNQAEVVDLAIPTAPQNLGPITMPGAPRGAAWVGDTLVVATGYAVERLVVSPTPPGLAGLSISFDPASDLPRAVVSWSPVPAAGLVGLNVRRDVLAPAEGADPGGRAVNTSLLPLGATSVVDDSLRAGFTYRYRLVGYLGDGSTREIAQGDLAVPASPGVGRPFPNPFYSSIEAVNVPYQLQVGSPGGTMVLRVFNASGGLVRSMSRAVPADGGFRSMAWDGRNQNGDAVASGVYFLRLTGLGIDDAKRVVLFR